MLSLQYKKMTTVSLLPRSVEAKPAIERTNVEYLYNHHSSESGPTQADLAISKRFGSALEPIVVCVLDNLISADS